MKRLYRSHATFNRTRWTLFALFAICVAALGIGVTRLVLAGTPSSGTLSPSSPLINYTGGPFAVSNPSSPVGENPPVCAAPAAPCDEFALHVDIPSSTVSYSIVVTIDWTNTATPTTQGGTASDFDLYVYQSDNITKVGQGPGTVKPEIAVFQAIPGDYIIKVVPYDVAPDTPFTGKIELIASDSAPQPTPIPLPQATGSTPRYQVFTPPKSILTRTATPIPTPTPSQSPQGQPAVPSAGNGTDAGEPSIGVNWKNNRVLYQSYLTTFRLTFNDTVPASPVALWEDKSAATSQNSLDPIMFTDHGYNVANPDTSRTFVSQLAGTTSLASTSDNDGDTWTPSEGGSLHSGEDHQTVGAGPYHEIAPGVPFPKAPGAYPHAFYYCSQENAAASCSRSDDGGLTFGPSVPIYSLLDCGNLHGHVKVAPDGTAYVPNNGCGTDQAVVASENNGLSWEVRNIPNSGASASDPWVALGRGDTVPGGRVYFSYAQNDGKAMVSVSDDHGKAGTWKNQFDVGAAAGVIHTAFPVVIAGDDDRAAVAFLGTSAKGSIQDRAFPGVWYLYIAHTYDGGLHWTTVNATPNDPIQRGGIWLGGGSPPHRNLLDFIGIDVDRDGRVVVGYADGCTGPACVQAPYEATGNSYTELAAIARQTGGRRLFGPDTPATTTATAPGIPYVSAGRDGSVVHLTWSESDDGGSAITNYKIMRGTTSGGETFLANAGTTPRYNDTTAVGNTTYYYKVIAVNALGESNGNNEVAAPLLGDSCNGVTEVTDPAGDQKSGPANGDLDILSIAVADRVEGGQNQLVFKMKVSDLSILVPNRQWRIIWNYPSGPPPGLNPFTGSFYVGMNSDGGAATFEYGIVSTVEAVPTDAAIPTRLGAANSGSFDQATGIITIIVSADKVGHPRTGDIIGHLVGRTFSGNGNETVKSQSAVDTTGVFGSSDPYTAASYMVVGNLNCSTASTPAISINDVTVTEGNGGTTNATFTVTLSAQSASTVTVKYDTANGTATAGSDYQTATGTVTFVPNDTSETFTVTVNGDTSPETDETFAVNLSNPTNATIADGQGTGTITNDDTAVTPPNVTINDVSVVEGNSGTTDAIFTVSLSTVSSSTVTVNFATVNGTATAGSDYQSTSGTLTFAPGQISKTISVPVIGDNLHELDETFTVHLSGATNATITDADGTGTIQNDEPVPAISINDVSQAEGNSGTTTFLFTVTLSRQSSQTTMVNFATANGTATSGSDYVSNSGVLTFNPGDTSKTITVGVNGDLSLEANETFFVNLSSPTNATIADAQGQGTILNDDTPGFQFEQASYIVSETGPSLSVVVKRTGDPTIAATVDYATNDLTGVPTNNTQPAHCEAVNGLASGKCDFATSGGRLRFAAGDTTKTVVLSMVDDVFLEGDEMLSMFLSNPSTGNLVSPSTTMITIQDNDTNPNPSNPYLSNAFFVRQQYLDFLLREPDTSGYTNWLALLTACPPNSGFLGSDVNCDRVQVSSGFFRSTEFGERGYWVYRFFTASLGRRPLFAEFTPEMRRLSGLKPQADLDLDEADFINDFIQRPEFTAIYNGLTDTGHASAFIAKLEEKAGVALPATVPPTLPGQPPQYNRQDLINKRASGEFTTAQTLRAFVEQKVVWDAYFFKAFVAMEYFGYLRRDPENAGYDDWVDVLVNGRPSAGIAPGDYRHLVFGFIYSTEYRERFGPQ